MTLSNAFTSALAALAVAMVACGKAPAPLDAGFDAGTSNDAGSSGPICLEDTVDAGATDAGWDGGYDFSCRGRAPAAGGQAELVVSGKVTLAGFSRNPLEGATVELLSATGVTVTTVTTDDAGTYRVAADAGCEPRDGQLRASYPPDSGVFPTYYLPPAPWTRDRGGLELVLFDRGSRGLAGTIANVTINDGTAVLAIRTVDCAGNPVEGVTVSSSSDAGAVRYVAMSGLPSPSLTSTGPSGEAVIFNLPAGSVDVRATLPDGGVLSRPIGLRADAITAATLVP